MIKKLLFLFLFFFSVHGLARGDAGTWTVTVTAGEFDRQNTVVTFLLPGRVADGIYGMKMKDSRNHTVYAQVDDNRAHFILEELPAGESVTYILDTGATVETDAMAGVTREVAGPSVTFRGEGRELLSYFYEESPVPGEIAPRFRRAGYIHPVYTPGGVRVTQHFNPSRPHQYGIWSAWSKTEFQGRMPEFWGAHEDGGRVVADTIALSGEGPVFSGFRAKHRYVDFSAPEPVTALNEQWDTFVYFLGGDKDYYFFDLHITESANTAKPVRILQHKYGYGGINIRGHEEWIGERAMNFMTSGGYSREEVVGERIRWSYLWGDIQGKTAGIGLLAHPQNDNHPLSVFINQEGEPFFSYGPLPLKSIIIEAGTPRITKYRFVVQDGKPDPQQLEQWWNDYAYPPGVTVRKKQNK
ncbi:Methane oxygenase PmoA [Fodinibius roseus]|uniref:Methane oxygenase PmoA n=1 Tax=Fodinibius roseus TaxID=1194090 RepID=A0A1M5JL16_9BACT|nr:DUF6807 family protein [Fodinibius roseus]SHG40959.1 Methane oxygenase PmoA [Fodinibius roseus]